MPTLSWVAGGGGVNGLGSRKVLRDVDLTQEGSYSFGQFPYPVIIMRLWINQKTAAGVISGFTFCLGKSVSASDLINEAVIDFTGACLPADRDDNRVQMIVPSNRDIYFTVTTPANADVLVADIYIEFLIDVPM